MNCRVALFTEFASFLVNLTIGRIRHRSDLNDELDSFSWCVPLTWRANDVWPNFAWPNVAWINVAWPNDMWPNIAEPNALWQNNVRPNVSSLGFAFQRA